MYYHIVLGHRLKIWIIVFVIVIFSFSIVSISAEESLIPSWIRNTIGFWVSGDVSDQEFIAAIEWMLENNVIQVSQSVNSEQMSSLQDQLDLYKSGYDKLEKENEQLKTEIDYLENQLEDFDYSQYYYEEPENYESEPEVDYSEYCYGSAACFVGTVTSIIDGDTIIVDGQSIRFSLVDTPEKKQPGFDEARDFIEEICPVGSTVLVDEDDQQTAGSYDRMVAVVYCHDTNLNLNEAVLYYSYGWITIQYCTKSEFGTHNWALAYGCGNSYYSPPSTSAPKYSPPSSEPEYQPNCDPHYPTVCIPTYPPDLDCSEISFRNFQVLQPDPHGFDGDKDGIGCES